MTFYLEKKAILYFLRLTCVVLIVLSLIITAPYWLALVGAIGITLMVIGACAVPLFFTATMLMGRDYKDRER